MLLRDLNILQGKKLLRSAEEEGKRETVPQMNALSYHSLLPSFLS